MTSRRQAPAPPAVLGDRFPAAVDIVARYADWLADAGSVRGLLGPREIDRLWDRHLLNCIAVSELVPYGSRLVDVGSGAGLPGLAIACVRPDLTVDLLEPLLRRVNFLAEVIADLGLADRVQVTRGRADEASVARAIGGADYVTARAVAPLDKLAQWCRPLLSKRGNLLAIKGKGADDEVVTHRIAIERGGTDIVGVVECGLGLVEPAVRVVHLRRR